VIPKALIVDIPESAAALAPATTVPAALAAAVFPSVDIKVVA
jgi:hypothetical protein